MRHSITGLSVLCILAASTHAQIYLVPRPPGSLGAGYPGSTIGMPDIDGDGCGEFGITAYAALAEGDPRRGRFYIHSGRTREIIRSFISPLVRSGSAFGGPIAILGDIDADGFYEIALGEIGQTLQTTGYAHVFSTTDAHHLYSVTNERLSAGSGYGLYLNSVPDIDSDGIDDFAVGDPDAWPPLYSGEIYIYSGATGALLQRVQSPTLLPGDDFFIYTATRDLNGDGLPELITRSFEPHFPDQMFPRGVLYFFSGTSDEWFRRTVVLVERVSEVPDLNFDGVPDILIGYGSHNVSFGIVRVLSGATGEQLYERTQPTPTNNRSQFGRAVLGVPDLDADGAGDFLVGAVTEHAPGFPINSGPGAAFLYSGATGTLLRRYDSPLPISSGFFGSHLVSVPDINGDAVPEFLISAVTEQRVYLAMSCVADWDRSWQINSQDFFAYLTDLFTADPRADVNKDRLINSQDFFEFLAAFLEGCD